MTATQELVERLKDVAGWKQIIERHRRITDDPAISYVLKDGTRVHEDENVIAKLAASLSRALEGAADTASAAAERLSELERENARMREAICTAVDSARPYRDESGVIEISLHPFGALMRVRDDIARAALAQDPRP
jgi:Zn-dependent M32 family carboxypeptidase